MEHRVVRRLIEAVWFYAQIQKGICLSVFRVCCGGPEYPPHCFPEALLRLGL